ncbi:MAG: dicarboxylate/amino acid:cation symporter [bacterium]
MKSNKNGKILICIVTLLLSVLLYSISMNKLAPVPPLIIQIIRAVSLFTALIILLEHLFDFQTFTKILLGMILGAAAGLVFKSSIAEIKPVGTAFIRLIQMIIIPLVFASLVVGTASLGDGKKMGRIGIKTLVYYFFTTAFAIILGLMIANLFEPGSGLPADVQQELMQNYQAQAGEEISTIQEETNLVDTVLNIIPTNPFKALSQGELLQIIFFAILLGLGLALIPNKKSSTVMTFFDGINDASIKIVNIAIKLAPYGVFALLSSVVSSFGTDILFSLLKYAVITIVGMIIMIFIYPLIVFLFTGTNPITFIKSMRSPQLIAFSTSSSAAALPVTINTCEKELGVPKNISSFVLPLGATVNMDGTALYQGISALFIAQVYGMSLTLGDQLTIVLTATLASIGTAGAPGAGMLMLVLVLKQVGIPLEGISLIIGVERILDMFRTTVNITGDASAAVIVAGTEGELGKAEEYKERGKRKKIKDKT